MKDSYGSHIVPGDVLHGTAIPERSVRVLAVGYLDDTGQPYARLRPMNWRLQQFDKLPTDRFDLTANRMVRSFWKKA